MPIPQRKAVPKKTTEQRLRDLEKGVDSLLSTNIKMFKMISNSHADIVRLTDEINKLKKKSPLIDGEKNINRRIPKLPSVWKDGRIVANVLGVAMSPTSEAEYPKKYRYALDRLIPAKDYYEIYTQNVDGKRSYVKGLTCQEDENGNIIFTFIETDYK